MQAVQNFPSRQTMIRALIIGALSTTLAACGGGGPGGLDLVAGGSGGGGTVTPVPTPSTTPVPVVSAARLSLTWDKTTVKTGGKDKATLTITALNSASGIQAGATINVSSASGVLSNSVVVTNDKGQATLTYDAGNNLNNRSELLTVTSGKLSMTTVINVIGTELTLAGGNAPLAGGATTELDAVLRDGEGTPIGNTEIIFTTSGAGSATLNPATAKTDSTGNVKTKVTGGAEGRVTITASALGASKASTVDVVAGAIQFAFTEPNIPIAAVSTGSSLGVEVKASSAKTVVFVTTLGEWQGANPANKTVIEVPVKDGKASATLINNIGGTASVQAYDKDRRNITSSFQAVVSAPVSAAAKVTLQALPAVVAPSTGTQKNSVNLTVSVTDKDGKPVANAPVFFEIKSSLGGGEYVSPAATITGDGTDPTLGAGKAKASFFSGALSSGQSTSSVEVIAKVLLPDGTTIKSYDLLNPAKEATSIVIGGTAGSVSIGQSTKIIPSEDNTYYKLPMSVLVADSNGNPMANTTVNLSAWPVAYSTGSSCLAGATFKAEDGINNPIYENLSLDNGEDGKLIRLDNKSFTPTDPLAPIRYIRNDFISLSSTWIWTITNFIPTSITGVPNGILSPINSAAGSTPSTVTTDANGVASFNYTYLKSNAIWTVARFRASTLVQGTETRSEITFRLPTSIEDDNILTAKCFIPDSPYNAVVNIVGAPAPIGAPIKKVK